MSLPDGGMVRTIVGEDGKPTPPKGCCMDDITPKEAHCSLGNSNGVKCANGNGVHTNGNGVNMV